MINDPDWELKFNEEIDNARIARQNANEGRARVCARRAAGVVIGEYFERADIPLLSSSAFDRLQALKLHPDAPSEAKQIVEHFLQRVDIDHHLPGEIDLIDEAVRLHILLLD